MRRARGQRCAAVREMNREKSTPVAAINWGHSDTTFW